MLDRDLDNVWYDDRIEPYVDGELSEGERRLFEERMSTDESLRHDVEFASKLKQMLQSVPDQSVPTDVIQSIQEQTTGRVSSRPRLRLAKSVSLIRRTGYAGIAIAASLAAIILLTDLLPTVPADEAEPSQAEVDRALLEVKQTLAFVSTLGSEQNEIMNGHVVQPMQKAMSYIFHEGSNSEIQ